jgi:hypothetical protein
MYNVVENYLTGVLLSQLRDFGVDSVYCDRIIATVREQILSCVYHWNDKPFRKALLLIGSEEGSHYKPAAADDIRNSVVVAIRNSEIESIQHSNAAEAKQNQGIVDADIKKLTASAIEYFSKADLPKLARQMEPPETDKYYALSKKYPISWLALSKLAEMKSQTADYPGAAVLFKRGIDSLPVEKEKLLLRKTSNASSVNAAVIGDALAFSVDSQLLSMLKCCAEEKQPFLVDSFKFLTRNIEKLLMIMEYLLSNNAQFVTSNFYIVNGHLERRAKPLKPGRSYDDAFRNWQQTAGLGARHKAVLFAAVGR